MWSCFSAALVLTLAWGGPSAARGATVGVSSDPLPSGMLASAIAARASLGFPIDDAAVAGLTVDSITEYGAALTSDELATLDARIQLQLRLAEARNVAAGAVDVVTGVSVQPDGHVIVTTTDADSEATKAVEGAVPASASLDVVVVPYSEADLARLQEEVISDVKDLGSRGIDLTSVGIDPLHDEVVAGVAEPASDVADYLVARYGPGLSVHQGSITTTSCTGCKTFSPIRGGLEMLNAHGFDSGLEQCTTGFNARPSGSGTARYVIAAGHCWPSTTTTTITHNGTNIGAVTADTLGSGCCLLADSLRLTRNSSLSGTPWNALYLETPPHPPVTAYPITGQVNHTALGIGDAVCAMGVTSQVRCGTINALDQTYWARGYSKSDNSRWGTTLFQFNGMVEASFYSYEGDSGGPVYIANQAYGIVAATDGSNSFFSAIDLAMSELSFAGTLRLCLNSACS